MQRNRILPSPSRTYVAVCLDFQSDKEFPVTPGLDVTTRHYFRKFKLPIQGRVEGYETTDGAGDWVEGSWTPFFPNTAESASWYFLNELNFSACIEKCIPLEQFLDLKNEDAQTSENLSPSSRVDVVQGIRLGNGA